MTRISNDRHGPFLPQTWVGWGERTSCSQSAHVRYLAGRSTLRVLLNPLFTTGSPSLGSSHNHQSPGNVHVLKVEHAPNLPMPLQFLPLSCLPGRANAGPVQRNLPPPPKAAQHWGGFPEGGGVTGRWCRAALPGKRSMLPHCGQVTRCAFLPSSVTSPWPGQAELSSPNADPPACGAFKHGANISTPRDKEQGGRAPGTESP